LAQKDGIFGFNLYLGARVGVQARDANIFVSIDQVEIVYASILKLFQRFGYRDNRNKNRLHFLLNDVGMDNFADAIRDESGLSLLGAGITMVQSQSIALGSNRVLGRDGKFAYKIIVPSGIFSGSDLIESAKSAKEYGSGNIRFTYDQNLYIISIDPTDMDKFESTELIQKYIKFNNLYFRDMIACAGVLRLVVSV